MGECPQVAAGVSAGWKDVPVGGWVLSVDVPGECMSLWEGDPGVSWCVCPWWVFKCVTPWMGVLGRVVSLGEGGCPRRVSRRVSRPVSPRGAVQGGRCRGLVSTRLRSHLPQPEPRQLPVPPSDQLCRPHGHLPPRGGDIGGHGGVHGDTGRQMGHRGRGGTHSDPGARNDSGSGPWWGHGGGGTHTQTRGTGCQARGRGV